MSRESMAYWGHILQLTAHPKSKASSTQDFTRINKIISVSSLMVHIFYQIVGPTYTELNRKAMRNYN